MNRIAWMLLTIVVGLALVTVPALAQRGPAGAPRAGGPGAGGPPGERPPLTAEHIEQLKKMHALNSELRSAQLDLLGLRTAEADQKKIDAKTEQISKLQEQVRTLAAEERPGIGLGRGMGIGPRGSGRGPGPGGGPGFGMGRSPRGWGGEPGAGFGQRWQHGQGGGRGFGQGQGLGRGRGGQGFGRGPAGGWGGNCPAGRMCPYR